MTFLNNHPIRKRTVFIFFSLLAFIVYANSFSVPFHYDDFHFLKENLRIKSLKTFSDWLFTDYSNFLRGRPLLLFSFFLNYKIGGLDTFTYHLFNLFFHISTAYIFYLLFTNFSDRKDNKEYSIKFIIAASVFIVQPINTESVTYISSRSSILSTLFILLSMLTFFKATNNKFSFFYYILAFLTFICGLLTKEIAIILPILLLLFDYYFTSENFSGLSSRLKYHIPFLSVVIVGLFYYSGSLANPEAKRQWTTHIFTEFRVFVEYTRLLIIPIGQNIDHDIKPYNTLNINVIFSMAILLLLISVSFIIKKKNRIVSFSILWFFVSISPFLVIRLNDFMAERWLYTSAIGYSLFISELFNLVSKKNFKLGIVLTASVILILGSLTIARNRVYANQVSLWEDASRKSPDKPRPYANLSRAYKEIGNLDKAIENGIKSIDKGGKVIEAYINLSVAYKELGDYRKAEETLKAIETEAAKYYEFYQNLGAVYVKMERYNEALDSYKKALLIAPDSALILFSIGETYENLDDNKKAKEYFMLSTKKIPQTAQDYMARGVSYFKLGNGKEALRNFLEAVRTDPLDVNVRIFLANNYLGNDYFDDAYRHFSAASKISTNYAPAYKGMGLAMLGKGNKKEAAGHFKKALNLLPVGSAERKEIEELLAQARN